MHMVMLPPSPQFSWLGFGLQVPSDGASLCAYRRATNVGISVVLKGRRFARWIHRGHEVRWRASTGAVHFAPADDDFHTYLMKSDVGCDLYTFWIPSDHLASWSAAEGVDAPVEWRRLAIDDDRVLRPCMNRLARSVIDLGAGSGTEDDETARCLVLRLAELHGGAAPHWRKDRSVFDGRTLRSLVVYIDEHLRVAPSLSDVAALVGMSPSHFARKFRQSLGVSLSGFVNLRRVQASLESLKNGLKPLAIVAIEAGFSSQSHFTRVFGKLTGMTPAKYRKQFRRTVR